MAVWSCLTWLLPRYCIRRAGSPDSSAHYAHDGYNPKVLLEALTQQQLWRCDGSAPGEDCLLIACPFRSVRAVRPLPLSLAPQASSQRFLDKAFLMPWRIVVECAKDRIPQGLIKRPGLKTERIEVRSGHGVYSAAAQRAAQPGQHAAGLPTGGMGRSRARGLAHWAGLRRRATHL